MSANGPPDAVTPDMVVRERNFLQKLKNALGLSDDFDADDTMRAATVYNTARQVQLQQDLLAAFTGSFEPEISIGDVSVDLEPGDLAAALEDAMDSENVLQIYNASVIASDDNVLTQNIRPQTRHSSFRVTVSLDTGVSFATRIQPDAAPDFTMDFKEGNALTASAVYQFEFDADPEAEYNFRCGGAATVDTLRVQEVFTE
jgi:hypothetical protein